MSKRLYTHVPVHVREKMALGQFVELHLMLFDRQRAIDDHETLGLFNSHGVLQAKPVSQYRPIADWAEWQKAFRIFEALHLEFFPNQADQLKAYQMHIQELALGFKWSSVNNYDRLFRHGIAEGLYRSWVEVDQLLYSAHFNPATTLLQKVVPGGETRNKPSTACKLYNSDKCKWGSKCRWAHRCSVCNVPGHPATHCRGGKSNPPTPQSSTTSVANSSRS